jgi:hypothetical protein
MENGFRQYIDKELRNLEGLKQKDKETQYFYEHLLNDPLSYVYAKEVFQKGKLFYFIKPVDCPFEDLCSYMAEEDFVNTYQML